MNCEKVWNHIVSWMKSYAEKAGLKGWVVGVSGGVDSALVSTLCAKTGMPTVLVEMPINRTMGPISDRAEAHCDWLMSTAENVTAHYLDLSRSYNMEVLKIYNDRHTKNAYKMNMPEVCIIPLEVRMAA